VTRTLPAPSGKMLYDEWRISRQYELHGEAISDSELANTRIGSGSDHTVFLNFLGIPTVGFTFVGPYGVYHSMYDDFYWMNHFGDPEYRYHALMAQLWGVMALRLANAEILPFDFASYGGNIRRFISSLDAATHLSMKIDLVPLQDRVAAFEAAGRELNESVSGAISRGRINGVEADRVNEELMQVERNWCDPAGIPGRPWWKHTLYGARYTYAHLELPGLTEAAEAGDWARGSEQAKILESALMKNTELLHRVKNELDSIAARDQR
jgi:N-acetylated-alpha-linked acidic dipeptidase